MSNKIPEQNFEGDDNIFEHYLWAGNINTSRIYANIGVVDQLIFESVALYYIYIN